MKAASLPKPLRITLRGVWRTLSAFLAIPMAPSAAAKDSWPAKKQKHLVASFKSIAAKLPCPKPTWRCSATLPGMQKVWRPSPTAAAASEAFWQFFLRAIPAPRVYAQTAFSNAIGWMERTIFSASTPLERLKSRRSSKLEKPYFSRTGWIWPIRRS